MEASHKVKGQKERNKAKGRDEGKGTGRPKRYPCMSVRKLFLRGRGMEKGLGSGYGEAEGVSPCDLALALPQMGMTRPPLPVPPHVPLPRPPRRNPFLPFPLVAPTPGTSL